MRSKIVAATGNSCKTGIACRARKRCGRFGALIFAALLTGCGSGIWTTKVHDVLTHPDKYVGQEVTLSGKVTKNVKLPLLPGVYWVDDGTGEIPVITQSQTPGNATRVKIVGRIEYVATVGATSLGLHVAEIRRR